MGFAIRVIVLVIFFIIAVMVIKTTSRLTILQKTFKALIVFLSYCLISSFVLGNFMEKWGVLEDNAGRGFNEMLAYKAYKPWSFRILTPALVNSSYFVLNKIIPDKLRAVARSTIESDSFQKYIRVKKYTQNDTYVCKYMITYYIMFFSLIMFLYFLRYMTKELYELPEIILNFAPVFFLLFLPLTFHRGGYIYDFPELLLITICLIFMIKEKWLCYYIFYILAVLNKEADALLILYFIAFKFKKLETREFITKFCLTAFIGVSLIVLLRYIYIDYSGHGISYHLVVNIYFWYDVKNWLSFFSISPGLSVLPRPTNIFFIFGTIYLSVYNWENKSYELRKSYLYMMIVLAFLFLTSCYLDEIRNFSLVFPVFYLVSLHSILSLYLFPIENKKI